MKNTKTPDILTAPGITLLCQALTRDTDRPIFDATGRLPGTVYAGEASVAAACGYAAASGRAGAAVIETHDGALAACAGMPVVLVVLCDTLVPTAGSRWSVVVREAAQLTRAIQQALTNTLASAPGPVLVRLHPEALAEAPAPQWHVPPSYPALNGAQEDVEAAASALSVCQTPVLILGPQWRFSRHPEALRPFVVRMELPCFAVGCAAGGLPADSRFVFRAGLTAAISAADLVLTVGVAGDSPLLTGLPALAFLVQVDLDPSGHHPSADVALRADAGRVMAQLTEYREDDGWLLQVRAFEQAAWEGLSADHQAIRTALSEGAEVVIAEVAADALPSASEPGRHLTVPHGAGAGAALGAGLAWPTHSVTLLSGEPAETHVFPPVKSSRL
ncbi:MAG: hypothetical protein P8R54_25455 [Myxococcota bacterium]|nr:hypothetical protein [Myxococcota bacterium]